jgi:hypothetical protein
VQRNKVQAVVKEHANGWWHFFADLWIVGGRGGTGHGPTTEWRDLILKSLGAGSGVGVLVLQLPPNSADRWWAMSGPDGETRAEWLRKNLRG